VAGLARRVNSFLAAERRKTKTHSLLEEIIERAAGIGRIRRRNLATVSAAGVSCLPLDGSTGHKQVAPVSQVLLCNTLGDGLRALKLGSGVKVSAIFTGVQVGFALGALAFITDLQRRRNDCAA